MNSSRAVPAKATSTRGSNCDERHYFPIGALASLGRQQGEGQDHQQAAEACASGRCGVVCMFSWTLDLRRALVRKERQRDADAERLARERMEVATFCSQVLEPALDDLKAEFEKLGRAASIHRSRTTYHLTVGTDRMVEFAYSIKACRKRRTRWLFDYSTEVAVEYTSDVDRTYDLRDIRRTSRRKVVAQVIADYRKRLDSTRTFR